MTSRPLLLTIDAAAAALSVSPKTIRRLIDEADANRKSRWRWGRELIDLAPVGSSRRLVRVNVAAVAPLSCLSGPTIQPAPSTTCA